MIAYCNKKCREEDRDHQLECSIMGEVVDLPDISRIMARLLLKLSRWGEDQSETLPFSQGERSFSDLLSHSDKIEDTDDYGNKIFEQLIKVIPEATKSWEYFKEVYGKLLINSFEISGDDDEKLGWALYLGPSILDHSCVPTAEVEFSGKKILVKSKINLTEINLRRIFISYIDIGSDTDRRRNKLKKYYHFDCLCPRCVGIKLGWVASEPFNHDLSDVLVEKESLVRAVEKMARGKERDFLESIRCQKCSGRPVRVEKNQEEAQCSFCKEFVEEGTLKEYFDIKQAVEKVLDMDEIPADAAPQCMELMTGLFHPYNLTYISTCQVALTDCILQNRLRQGLEFAQILLSVSRRLAKGSPAQVELVIRMMRLLAELGMKEELDEVVQNGLVDAYTSTELCTDILKYRDKMFTIISNQSNKLDKL